MAGEPIITIVGNLTADPELRYVSSGIPVASFTVASTPRTMNKQTQQWEDGEAMFVRCSVWRAYGENVAASLTKGMRVIVQGRLQQRSYEHNGERRTSLELQVDEVGPSLRYAVAQVQKTSRISSQNPAQGARTQSQWGSTHPGAFQGAQQAFNDEAPF